MPVALDRCGMSRATLMLARRKRRTSCRFYLALPEDVRQSGRSSPLRDLRLQAGVTGCFRCGMSAG
jgi:hypothetical protein